MGKASKWFRGLFGLKKPSSSSSSADPSPSSSAKPHKEKRRWSFVTSYREKDQTNLHSHSHSHSLSKLVVADHKPPTRPSHDEPPAAANSGGDEFSGDHDKHAIAVLAATSAVADAAVAAAQAAAAVVRLTSAGSGGGAKNHPAAYVSGSSSGIREEWAAVKIQSAYRGRLARRALRALKGLVKMQALVRGHIERKRTAELLHRMQALMQAQARAIGGRSQVSEFHHSTSKSSNFHNPGPVTLEKFEHSIRSKSRKHDQPSLLRKSNSRLNGRAISDHDKTDSGSPSESQLDERSGNLRSSLVRNTTTDDKKSDRILEINTGKPPHITPKRRNLFHSSDRVIASDHYSHSFTTSKDSTTHHTLPGPSSYKVQPLTPLKLSNNDVEEGSFCTANNSRRLYSASYKGASSRRSSFTPSDYPNFMACTESSKAKVRSLGPPKQRPNYVRSSSAKRYSIDGVGESKQSGQRISALHVNFMNKAYPGSGRFDNFLSLNFSR